MSKYIVQSPIKMGGQRYAVGAPIEMDGKAAAEALAQGLIAKEGETAAAIPPPPITPIGGAKPKPAAQPKAKAPAKPRTRRKKAGG